MQHQIYYDASDFPPQLDVKPFVVLTLSADMSVDDGTADSVTLKCLRARNEFPIIADEHELMAVLNEFNRGLKIAGWEVSVQPVAR